MVISLELVIDDYDALMSEVDAIARAVDGPVTLARLREDLACLGVEPRSVLMVHSSLSALGWVVGGAVRTRKVAPLECGRNRGSAGA